MTLKDRPPQDVLDLFVGLGNTNAQTRLNAAAELVKLEKLLGYKQYVLKRMLKGLSSGKPAADHGFSAALSLLLQKHPNVLTVDEYLALLDSQLQLIGSPSERNAAATGQHLALAAAESATEFRSQGLRKLLTRHVTLIKKAPFLEFSVANALGDLADDKQLDKVIFKKSLLPLIRPNIAAKLIEIELFGFVLLLRLAPRFTKTLGTINVAVQDKRVVMKTKHHAHIIKLIKSAAGQDRNSLCALILRQGIENHQIAMLYNSVVLEYVWSAKEPKACARYFTLMTQLFADTSFGSDQLLQLVNTKFIVACRKYARRVDPAFRGIHASIAAALTAAGARVESGTFASSDLLHLVTMLDQTEGGDFDTRVALQTRFSESLIAKLDDADYQKFAERAFNEPHWSFKRVAPSFASRSSDTKKAVLDLAINIKPSTEQISAAVSNMMMELFRSVKKYNKLVDVTIKDEDATSLLELAKSKRDVNLDFSTQPLQVMSAALRLLSRTSIDEAEAQLYIREADELISLCSDVNAQSGTLMDLLISILTRTHRIHRTLVHFAIAKMHRVFKPDDIRHVVEGICQSNDEILAGDDEEDEEAAGDGKRITEEERRAVLQKWAAMEEGGDEEEAEADEDATNDKAEKAKDEDESMSSEDEESNEKLSVVEDEELDPNAEVDPLFVTRVKAALGDAAYADSDDSDIAMDDDELEELDKNLAVALRAFTSRGRKEQLENVKVFRSKCIELLGVWFGVADRAATIEAADALTTLLTFLRSHSLTELLNKASGVVKAAINRHKQLKQLFERQNNMFVPKKATK